MKKIIKTTTTTTENKTGESNRPADPTGEIYETSVTPQEVTSRSISL